GSTLYVGGIFTQIGGQTLHNLAAVDTSTALATPGFAPEPSSRVTALSLVGSTLYAGGRVTSIGGASRAGIAQLDPATGAAMPWSPQLDKVCFPCPDTLEVDSIAVSGPNVYLGGENFYVGADQQYGLVAFDATTAQKTSWNPGISDLGFITNVIASGQTI